MTRRKPIVWGQGTYFGGPPVTLWESYGSRAQIGKYCSIAAGVTFILGGHHDLGRVTTYPWSHKDKGYTKGSITIGNDVWIGHGVTILDGVTIGDGAVIGAMAVVASDVPPYAVAVGNPAQVIKYRFTSDVIQELLSICWWDWPPEKIKEVTNWSDVHEFIHGCKDATPREVSAQDDPKLS